MLAARFRTLPAAIAPVAMGGGLAVVDGVFAPLPFAAALLGAVLIQVGTNLANDYSDYVRGADTEARQGGVRVTQAGMLRPEAVRAGAAWVFGLAVLVGLYLVLRGGWPVLVIGLASILAGVAYTGGPWPFGYHGLGDLFVFVFFGWIAVAGTYYVQALTWSPAALWAGSGAGAAITAILVVNNLRDRTTDAGAGKKTLAVWFGARFSQVEYAVLLIVAAVVPVAGVLKAAWPAACLLSLIGLAAAVPALRTVWSFRTPGELNPALGRTAAAAGWYGVLFSIGCLW